MPWTVKDVPRFTKKAKTAAQKKKWVSIANSALESCQSDGGSDCEGYAVRVANSKFALVDINSPWTLADVEDHDEYFGLATKDDKKKPGGSNAGKYKTKGPFCGPSGGAPKGTYPVNTKARAISAISYARHAPNPAGIKKCVCSHWPGLPACKSKEKQSMKALPKGALRFVEVGGNTGAFAVTGTGPEGKKKLQMTVYSGGIIKGHWYWNNLAIDLQGMKLPKGKFPVLEDHLQSKKIAFSRNPVIDDKGLHLDPEKTQFVSTPESEEFQRLSEEGFPYQASMYAKPSIVERIEEGSSTEINGFTFKGPGTIWRQCELKEASICVFGWDSKTQSSAFSKEVTEDVFYEEVGATPAEEDDEEHLFDNDLNLDEEEVNENMNKEELKEKYPDIYKEIQDEAVASAETKFSTEITALKESNSKLSDRVLASEKNEAIRQEKDRKALADKIWMDKLAASDIAEHMYEKVMPHVSHTKFMKDGKFDEEAFSKAIDDEIKSWIDLGATQTVMGSGFHQKEVGDTQTQSAAKEQKLVGDTTNDLLSRAGQPQKTTT